MHKKPVEDSNLLLDICLVVILACSVVVASWIQLDEHRKEQRSSRGDLVDHGSAVSARHPPEFETYFAALGSEDPRHRSCRPVKPAGRARYLDQRMAA